MAYVSEADSVGKGLLEGLRRNAGWTMAIGVLMIVIGALAIAAPFAAGVGVTAAVGVLVIVGGIAQGVLAFRAGALGRGLLMLLLGVIMVGVGLFLVTRPVAGLAAITLFLAAYFLAAGILAVIASFELKPNAGWGWMLVNGIVTILLGVLIYAQWPLSGTWALGVLFGVHLALEGVALVTVGRAVRRGVTQIAAA